MTLPVVLVPGLGLGPESYAPTVEHLQAPYDVVPLPGYGEPVRRGDDLRTEALAQRVAARVTEPSVLVGHSASCQIVVAVALAQPELVKGVVLLGPTGDVETSHWPTLAARWVRSAVWESPRLVPVLAPQYRRTGLVSMARAMEVARHYDLAAAITGLECPAIVVRSKHDSLCSPEWTRRLAELADGGEAWTLPTGSHMPVLTNGRELAEFINRAAGVYNQQ
ncbi:alpha/beta fold hydrolase [Kribbella sp. CA-293567]|uniref:alpha/beta fold hydrolase n=1 Tax=Kribbella sp. CA-293567 TaxID=3002436 RepID=UPI0022DE87EE|nr:alpha/beta hydrolase [Kribbella sp. CA-293567]WBQ05299.1 alpha/beta hydrolase [Kribbella sp. CA-293567]